jgi:hypothetical protein
MLYSTKVKRGANFMKIKRKFSFEKNKNGRKETPIKIIKP